MTSRSESVYMNFTGAVAVVTGGAAGIGQALALEAARRGAKVMIGDTEDASGTVTAIESAGGEAAWQRCDVGRKAEIHALRDTALSMYGKINLVCSNVGIGVAGPLHLVAEDDFERTMRVNVTGSYWVLQTFASELVDAAALGDPSVILFTGSEHSLGVPPTDRPPYVPQSGVYTMSKYALLGVAAVARRDLAEAGVHVAILCPGWTATQTARRYAEKDPHLRMVLETYSQEPAVVAERAFIGLDNNQHIIPTNAISRDFVVAAHQEIIDAVEAVL